MVTRGKKTEELRRLRRKGTSMKFKEEGKSSETKKVLRHG